MIQSANAHTSHDIRMCGWMGLDLACQRCDAAADAKAIERACPREVPDPVLHGPIASRETALSLKVLDRYAEGVGPITPADARRIAANMARLRDGRPLLRLKPGSLTADGAVIDMNGVAQEAGPCFIPARFGVIAHCHLAGRADALNRAGWRHVRAAADWPSIPPTQGALCVVRLGS